MIATRILAGALLATTAGAQDRVPSLERFPDWRARDLEGRWALLAPEIATSTETLADWVRFLAAEGEHELIEWIAITEPTGWTIPAGALEAAGAPQWIRVAARGLDHPDSHVRSAARDALFRHPAGALAWIDRCVEPPAIPFQSGPDAALNELRVELAAATARAPGGASPSSATTALPRLDEAALVAPIRHAASAVVFGDRLRAQPGVLHDLTVLRAIASTRTTQWHAPALEDALLTAVRQAAPTIARAACLAFTHFPPEEVPVDALGEFARDAGLDPDVRAAAFLASTHGWGGRVPLVLEQLLFDPACEHRALAADRLGELGDGFTLALLETRALAAPSELAAALEAAIAEIRAREQVEPLPWPRITRELLERAACAVLEGRPNAEERVDWTLAFLRAHLGEEALRTELVRIMDVYGPPLLHRADRLSPHQLGIDVHELARRALLERQ